ncbi:MAG: UDP-N-acetylglucosamine 2-epimerase (non-hydrolyzing) [Proteobacteria bacterium]|nr:UDP-N-acetylglucosamine 2-epimerase (non-hydrolyzing) [Pseudomonadota bacterium]
MNNKKIICIVGTRPEAIKLAPLILALKKEPWVNLYVLATAQHREMLDSVLHLFKIVPDTDLNIMSYDQKLPQLTADLISKLDEVFKRELPDVVIAQGDTTTVLAAALVSFEDHISFCHIEAGLRSQHIDNPFPEEMNRVISDRLSDIHCVPTEAAKQNLLNEKINNDSIYVTGNTIIDALNYIDNKNIPLLFSINPKKKIILVTAHRRENFGKPLEDICKGLLLIAEKFKDVEIIYSVHPNPHVRETAYKVLDSHPSIRLCEPFDYGTFIALMKQSYLILSDSGGIQEEVTALGKPLLILRENTERPEALNTGITQLVGTDPKAILDATSQLLTDKAFYESIAKVNCVYGDGLASKRIVEILKEKFT